MPISAKTLKLLMDAGLSGESLIAAVESIEADNASTPADNAPAPKQKSRGAIRQQRYRERLALKKLTDGEKIQ